MKLHKNIAFIVGCLQHCVWYCVLESLIVVIMKKKMILIQRAYAVIIFTMVSIIYDHPSVSHHGQ